MGRAGKVASSRSKEGVMRNAVAMTEHTASDFQAHLLRHDGQEDLCFGVWRPSTGLGRRTALIEQAILPTHGERRLHGNVSFEPHFLIRAAEVAGKAGGGLVFAHSHPSGCGWQGLNEIDWTAEARIANVAREVTGLPLVGLTLAGDGAWSGRTWEGVARAVRPEHSECVRVVGDSFSVTFNPRLLPVPMVSRTQVRTVSSWGESTQATIARLRVAVAGAGSVGMAVVDALARTGIQHIGVLDFDSVEEVNLDRLRGAGPLDASLVRSKAHVANRLLKEGSTAEDPRHEVHELSVCEPEGLSRLLDFDIIFSCVDRPWPRHVLNTIAYADLIPVIEGGIKVFQNPDGSLRNAYWRSTVVRPGRPCLACLLQYDPGDVEVERDGSLDDPSYIAGLPSNSPLVRRENVAALSTSATGALLLQFLSYVARPSGFGDPGPLMFDARNHVGERNTSVCLAGCPFQASVGRGDLRLNPAMRHQVAEDARDARSSAPRAVQLGRGIDDLLSSLRQGLAQVLKR